MDSLCEAVEFRVEGVVHDLRRTPWMKPTTMLNTLFLEHPNECRLFSCRHLVDAAAKAKIDAKAWDHVLVFLKNWAPNSVIILGLYVCPLSMETTKGMRVSLRKLRYILLA